MKKGQKKSSGAKKSRSPNLVVQPTLNDSESHMHGMLTFWKIPPTPAVQRIRLEVWPALKLIEMKFGKKMCVAEQL